MIIKHQPRKHQNQTLQESTETTDKLLMLTGPAEKGSVHPTAGQGDAGYREDDQDTLAPTGFPSRT